MKGIFTCKMTDWDCDLAQKQLILIERSVMFYVEDGLKCNIVGLMNCNSLSSVSTIYFLWEFPFRGNVQFKIIPLEWVSILMGSWDLCCKRFFPPCWVFGEPDPGMRNFLSLSLSRKPYILLETISMQSFWTDSKPLKVWNTASSVSGNTRAEESDSLISSHLSLRLCSR